MDQAEQVKAQYEYDQKSHDYSWAKMQDNYLYQMDTVELHRINEAVIADYKNKLAATQWAQDENLRITKYEAQITA